MSEPAVQKDAELTPLRCAHCGEVIGAYEPLVVRRDGRDRETAIAAEPGLPIAGAQHLHADCARETAPEADVVALNPPPPADGEQDTTRRSGSDRRTG